MSMVRIILGGILFTLSLGFIGWQVSWLNAESASTLNTNSTDDDNVVYRKKTVIDLAGDDIEGAMKTPGTSFIKARKGDEFSNIMRLKKRFGSKFEQSVKSVQVYTLPQ